MSPPRAAAIIAVSARGSMSAFQAFTTRRGQAGMAPALMEASIVENRAGVYVGEVARVVVAATPFDARPTPSLQASKRPVTSHVPGLPREVFMTTSAVRSRSFAQRRIATAVAILAIASPSPLI